MEMMKTGGSIEQKVLIALISLIFFMSCRQTANVQLTGVDSTLIHSLADNQEIIQPVPQQTVAIDLEQIRERGRLVALTGYSYTSYFMYKGTPMGYEYELMEMLARHLGVRLEIVLVRDMETVYDMLEKGEGDIVADNLIMTGEKNERIRYTRPYATTRQVLVQKSFTGQRIKPVRNLLDLQEKEVHVRRNSPYSRRLENLMTETGIQLLVHEVGGDIEPEEMIQMVARGEIEYTVADERAARHIKTWHPDIDIQTPVGFNQYIAWAVRAGSPDLLNAINQWLEEVQQKPQWHVLYHKYYGNSKVVRQMVNCSRKATCGASISPYDEIVIRESEKNGWDWRLITSLIYQESRFNPMALSWAGASGLMQLMPGTAAAFGVADTQNPLQSIRGGIAYLTWLNKYWKDKITDPDERIKFILASYNAGQEHVADARRLTAKYNKNPDRWEDVSVFLLLKANPAYHRDPVVRFGYCRGEEPVRYVEEVLGRYEHYKRLIAEDIYLAVNES